MEDHSGGTERARGVTAARAADAMPARCSAPRAHERERRPRWPKHQAAPWRLHGKPQLRLSLPVHLHRSERRGHARGLHRRDGLPYQRRPTRRVAAGRAVLGPADPLRVHHGRRQLELRRGAPSGSTCRESASICRSAAMAITAISPPLPGPADPALRRRERRLRGTVPAPRLRRRPCSPGSRCSRWGR